MATCEGCMTDKAARVQVRYYKDGNGEFVKQERCNVCASLPDTHFRDALGNRVIGRSDSASWFSHATGEVHTSTRQFADFLRRNGLVQKDGRNAKGSFRRKD
jgi:hypothetical protein